MHVEILIGIVYFLQCVWLENKLFLLLTSFRIVYTEDSVQQQKVKRITKATQIKYLVSCLIEYCKATIRWMLVSHPPPA